MSKRFIMAACVTLILGGSVAVYLNRGNRGTMATAPASARDFQELQAKLARREGIVSDSKPVVVAPLNPNQPVRMAIGWLGLTNEAQNELAGDLALVQLSSAKNLQMVDRQSLNAALHEMKMSLAGLVRAASAVRAGKLLKADWFLLGSAAEINGSNCVVLRLVDSRTGIVIDGSVLPTDRPATQLASDISNFARESRNALGTTRPKLYLAVGNFRDVSVNSRQAAFASQLRVYLNAHFQTNASVTVLERDAVEALLQEMRLDLAGLTENPSGGSPMASAFWFVDGYYQSYELTGNEVELVLRIKQILGVPQKTTLRGNPDETLFREVTTRIDSEIKKTAASKLFPNRHGEALEQMAEGHDFSRGLIVDLTGSEFFCGDYRIWPTVRYIYEPQDIPQYRFRLGEAIKAFQTALLLEPENREAKWMLAACLENRVIGRVSEARDYYHELSQAQPEDKWSRFAMASLGWSYRDQDGAQAAEWFKKAAANANDLTKNNYLTEVKKIAAELQQKKDAISDAGKSPEELLVKDLEAVEKTARDPDPGSFADVNEVFVKFIQRSGGDRKTTARRIPELLPGLREKFPDISPHLLAAAVCLQPDTNSAPVAEFAKSFDWCMENTNQVRSMFTYMALIDHCFEWCAREKLYDLAAHLLDAKIRKFQSTFYDNANLGFVCFQLGRWQDALDNFKKLPRNVLFQPAFPVPWNSSNLTPDELVFLCREKLGLATSGPQHFKLPDPSVHLDGASFFTTDESGIWLAIESRLLHLDYNLATNLNITLPAGATASCIVAGAGKVWIGTAGSGLVEFDKSTRQCRLFTTDDGLIMSNIFCLCLQSDALWIGFGYQAQGGLGRLDLATRRATGFPRTLKVSGTRYGYGTVSGTNMSGKLWPETKENAPNEPVTQIVAGPHDDLFVTESMQGIFHYHIHEDSWQHIPRYNGCTAVDPDNQIIVLCEPPQDHIEPLLLDLGKGTWEAVRNSEGVPAFWTSTIAFDGQFLWSGGQGYIGVIDMKTRTFQKLCYTHTGYIAHIEIAGGFAWVLADGNLYRIPVSITE